MVIALTVIAIISPLITLYGVYMGLKWNTQMQKQEPLERPFKPPHVQKGEPKEQAKAVDETQQILSEWIHGAGDE